MKSVVPPNTTPPRAGAWRGGLLMFRPGLRHGALSPLVPLPVTA
jgi:hypothetical protein